MPEGIYGLSLPTKAVALRQTATYYSGTTGQGTNPTTISLPPRYTCVAFLGADSGSGAAPTYSVSHTGYTWKRVHSPQVDTTNYPVLELWIGQPTTRGIAGGTTATFQHNGTCNYNGTVLFEFNQMLKGELVWPWWNGWGNTTLTPNSYFGDATITTPAERGLTFIYGACQRSGGVGPGVNALPFRGSGGTAGLFGAIAGWPYPRQVLSPINYVTNASRTQYWTSTGMFIR